jgi:hypothetical protein
MFLLDYLSIIHDKYDLKLRNMNYILSKYHKNIFYSIFHFPIASIQNILSLFLLAAKRFATYGTKLEEKIEFILSILFF